MKRVMIISGLLALGFAVSDAQTVDPKKAYEEFRQQALDNYNNFRQQANKNYADFLAEAWRSFKASPGIPRPKEKPVPPVKYDNKQPAPVRKVPVKIDTVIPPVVIPKQPQPVEPIPEAPVMAANTKSFTFYGTPCSVRYPLDADFTLTDISKRALSRAWECLSDSKYNNLIRDCLDARTKMGLCDWAYLQYLEKAAKACTDGNANAAVFLKDFLYCQSGYITRLGTSKGQLVMLVATGKGLDMYDKSYFNIDGFHFYPLNCDSENLQICTAEYPGEKGLSLIVGKEQHFASEITQQRVLTSSRYQQATAHVQTNKELIDFYNTYPQSQLGDDFGSKWQFYANTQLSETAQAGLYPAIKSAIKGMKQQDAANIILNFVQTALAYEYDDKVWGYDRPFFPDETLYYPYCDCEDRAILFSRIVRDIMHLDVVLIYYPNHLASAVSFTEDVNGDCVTTNGRKYVICDPTYINAPVGSTMPGMDNATAKAILLE